MHPLSFKSLCSRLVAVKIAPPKLRSQKGKNELPPVLMLPVLVLVGASSFGQPARRFAFS